MPKTSRTKHSHPQGGLVPDPIHRRTVPMTKIQKQQRDRNVAENEKLAKQLKRTEIVENGPGIEFRDHFCYFGEVTIVIVYEYPEAISTEYCVVPSGAWMSGRSLSGATWVQV